MYLELFSLEKTSSHIKIHIKDILTDTIDVSKYDKFFYQGLMDNGMEFGYLITIKEINNDAKIPYAIITISKK